MKANILRLWRRGRIADSNNNKTSGLEAARFVIVKRLVHPSIKGKKKAKVYSVGKIFENAYTNS